MSEEFGQVVLEFDIVETLGRTFSVLKAVGFAFCSKMKFVDCAVTNLRLAFLDRETIETL